MDFTFGKLISDELKLCNHRADRAGLQHQYRISPLDPAPGEAVTVHLRSSSAPAIARAELRFSADGSDPRLESAAIQTAPFRRIRREWDSLVWDYICHWQAELPPQAANTLVSYCIRGWTDSGDLLHADYPEAAEAVQHATRKYFGGLPPDAAFEPSPPGPPPLFSYHVDTLAPPQWARSAIIYHIFLDRFYPGDGGAWRQTEDLQGFCGGTLWGVRDKLDYLAELGINCLWLSPTWASPSPHGYDVADYERVEPRLGGEAALRALVAGARQRGIRVLLDFVANHLSNRHPIFLEALQDKNSPYRDWFTFGERYAHGYRSFFGVQTMPEINLEVSAAREWMLGNALKSLRDFEVDGFRLDVAAGAGPNFWTYCRPRLRAANPDCLLLGEIIDSPSYLRMYGGRLDGCLDFSLNEALRNTFAWESWDEARMRAFIASHQDYFGADFLLPSFIDNHDMDRFSFIANNDKAKLKRAVSAQMRLPNPPIILYGTEVGLRQSRSTRDNTLDACRMPMVWDARQETDLLAFYQREIQQRRARML